MEEENNQHQDSFINRKKKKGEGILEKRKKSKREKTKVYQNCKIYN